VRSDLRDKTIAQERYLHQILFSLHNPSTAFLAVNHLKYLFNNRRISTEISEILWKSQWKRIRVKENFFVFLSLHIFIAILRLRDYSVSALGGLIMGVRQEFEKRIKKKEQELNELRDQVARAESYLQAMYEGLRLLPKEDSQTRSVELRPNSELAKARDAIKAEGSPMHVSDILRAIGKPVNKATRVSLSGSLGAYARKGDIFTRPAPNTFGLKEFEVNGDAVNEGAGVTDTEPDDPDFIDPADIPF
jgi:hypothetical protein